MKNKRFKYAVSEVIGVALLLGLAISMFSLVQFTVLTYPFEPSTPSVSLLGSTEYNQTLNETHVIIQHNGGESLSLDTKILIDIEGLIVKEERAGDYPYLDINKNNSLWNIGEKYIYSSVDVTNRQVEVTIVDAESNSIIMRGKVQ